LRDSHIASGTYGSINLGTHNIVGIKVAIKMLSKDQIIEDLDEVENEINIMR